MGISYVTLQAAVAAVQLASGLAMGLARGLYLTALKGTRCDPPCGPPAGADEPRAQTWTVAEVFLCWIAGKSKRLAAEERAPCAGCSRAEAQSLRRSRGACTAMQCALAAAGAGSWALWLRPGGSSSNAVWSVGQGAGPTGNVRAAMHSAGGCARTAAASLRARLAAARRDLAGDGLASSLRSIVRSLQAQGQALAGRLLICGHDLQARGWASLSSLGVSSGGAWGSWVRAGRQGLSAAATHTAAVPRWLLAALACLLLQPLLARSSDARLLASAGGAAPPPTSTARSHGS